MELRKFVWVGCERATGKYKVTDALDTEDVMMGNYPKFFCLSNRKEIGDCKFIAELFNLDTVHFKMQSGEYLNFMLDIDCYGNMMLLGDTRQIKLSDMFLRSDIADITFFNTLNY